MGEKSRTPARCPKCKEKYLIKVVNETEAEGAIFRCLTCSNIWEHPNKSHKRTDENIIYLPKTQRYKELREEKQKLMRYLYEKLNYGVISKEDIINMKIDLWKYNQKCKKKKGAE